MTPVSVAAEARRRWRRRAGDVRGAASDEGLPAIVVVLLVGAAVVGAGVMLAGFRSGSR